MPLKQARGIPACVLAAALGGGGAPAVTQAQQIWLPAACDIKPGHQLVNSGMQSLKSAFSTKFADQRTKDLKDAERVLTQAVTTGNQAKNPAAWYYLGRYYLMAGELGGADSAFTKALTLARSEEHTSELQSLAYLVCRLLLEKKKKKKTHDTDCRTKSLTGNGSTNHATAYMTQSRPCTHTATLSWSWSHQ